MEISVVTQSGANLIYSESIWTGRKSLYVNGKQATKIKRRLFVISDANNNNIQYEIKGNLLTGVSVVSSIGEETILAKNKWYDWVMLVVAMAGIVFGSVFCGAIGGGLSAICCMLAAYQNLSISRSNKKPVVKICLQFFYIILANAIWVGLWFLISMLILSV